MLRHRGRGRDPFANSAGFAGPAVAQGLAVAIRPGFRSLSLLRSLGLLGLLGAAAV